MMLQCIQLAVAIGGRGRCKGRLRTGSDPKGSSPKQTRSCAVDSPVAIRGGRFVLAVRRKEYFHPGTNRQP